MEYQIRQLRRKDEGLAGEYDSNTLNFDESTFHFSSIEKEKAFVNAQFKSKEEKSLFLQYRQEWHRRSDELDPGTFPLAVIIELVSACNLRCPMCYTVTPEFQESTVGSQRYLPWDIVTNLIDEAKEIGVKSLLFSWRGESTIYRAKGRDGIVRDFADALAYARDAGILEVTSLTNGRALSDDLIERIVKARPNWLSFSIDGYGENYDKIRRPIREDRNKIPFEEVTNNIKKIVQLRDKLGLTTPQIRTNSIYPAIADNPLRYKEYMESIGVGLVTVNAMLDYRGAEMLDDDIQGDWFCQYPFQRLVISANGTIMPCPGAHNEEEELVLGRAIGSRVKRIKRDGQIETKEYSEVSLKDVWNSERMVSIRALHSANRRKEIWACKHCRHGAKKQSVNWVPDDWDMDRMQWNDNRVWRNG